MASAEEEAVVWRAVEAYYDKRADIFYIRLGDGPAAHSIEHPWGLVDVSDSDEPIGIELWAASKALPADMLGILEPSARQAA